MSENTKQTKKNRVLCALPPAYFPTLEYFWNLAQCDVLILTDHFQYSKRSPLTISAPLQESQPALTIPVRHGDPQAAIFEKQIDNHSNWSRKHLQTIRHLFHHAPYEYIYLPLMEDLLTNHPNALADFLTASLSTMIDLLHLKTKIVRASESEHSGNNEKLIKEWCNDNNCNRYLSNQEVYDHNMVNPEILRQDRIEPHVFVPFPEYHILKSNRELSILYFLFHFGPEAGYLLRQYLPLK